MKQKFKVRFSLIKSKRDASSDESQIYLVFRMNGNETFFYTGYRVKSENFITKPQNKNDKAMFIQSVKKNTYNKSGISASQINRRLQKVYVAANDVYEKRYIGKEHLFNNKEFVGYLLEELGETVKPIEEKGIEDHKRTERNIHYSADRAGTCKYGYRNVSGHRGGDVACTGRIVC